jgi:hypothetical protein
MAGDAVRLVASDINSIRSLVLKVSSLEKLSSLESAKTFLRESGMLGVATDNQITIATAKIEGLDVRLVG